MLLLGLANWNRDFSLDYPHSPDYLRPAINLVLTWLKSYFFLTVIIVPNIAMDLLRYFDSKAET